MKSRSRFRIAANVFGSGFRRTVFLLSVCLALCVEISAQNVQYTNEAVDMGIRSTRRINPITLGVEFEIPLGRYKGRGGLDVPVTISYSSKLWGIEFQGYNPGAPPPHFTIEPYTIVTANYARHTVRGWTTTINMPTLDFLPGDRIYNPSGAPNVDGNCTAGCYKIDRMMVWMPDGSGHELRASDQPRLTTTPAADNLYAVDGTRMRYQRSTATLFMPDGSRYLFPGTYVDRNGNTLTWVGGFRDTLNRVINDPLPWGGGGGPLSPVEQSYSIPGVGTTTLNYTLKWKYLHDSLTDPTQPIRYIANSACPPGTGTFSPNLFATDFSGRTCIANAGVVFDPVVLSEIVLPNGRSYTFTYTVYGEISKVVLPTGGYETFTHSFVPPVSSPINFKPVYAQANRGVTRHRISHTGQVADEVEWQYSSIGTFVTMTAPDGTRTENYLWADGVSGWGYSADSSRSGKSYDERVYNAAGVMLRRKLTEWAMTPSNASGNPSGTLIANRNARKTRELEFILDTGGGPALARSKTFGYNLTFQYDVGIEETSVNEYDFFDVDQATAQTLPISQMGTIPLHTLLRTTENDYLTSDVNYRSRNLLGLKTATRIKNGSGTVIAQNSNNYDGKELLTYSSVLNWSDPATTVRGNITSSTRWLNFDGTAFFTYPNGPSVATHTQYDQCGSPRKIWDPRDTSQQNPSLIDYSDTFHRAYATTNTSADPDGAGGPKSAFVTTMEYDLNTGLVLATVDANLQRTEYNYDDPLIRLKRVTRAATDSTAKNQTTYAYDDVARTLTATSDLTTFNDNALKLVRYFDGLGRLSETRMHETAANYIVTLQEYDDLGRASKKSNPYRPWLLETPVWTETAYDSLNRAISVTAPDNTIVTTDYSGSRVLVTDQNLRQRISTNDALGRLAEVWEITPADGATEPVSFPNKPGITAGYLTKYSYDVLDDLTLVTQRIGTAGTIQNRTFTYDSLGRVVTAVNPESNTLNYRYDNNSNLTQRIDSRSPAVTITDSYDFLNRLTGRSYSDGTPAVTYNYDAASVLNAKGRLTSVSSSVSTYTFGEYDALGRVRNATQTTDGQAYVMNYTHDLAGHLKSQSYPSGRVVLLEYDGAGRTAGVRNQATGLFYAGAVATDDINRIQYSPHGAINKMKLGNGLWEHTDFNLRLQSTQIGLGTAATNSSVLQLDFNYGTTTNNGNLLGQTITLPGLTLTQTYTYDALNRVETTNENSGNSWKQKFLYDRYGNRRVDSNSANTSPDLVGPNPVFSLLNNRIVAQSGEQYLHDGAGNLTIGRDGQSYAYDGENRMKQFNGGAGSGGADYSYDADGRRVKKVVGSVTTVFIYDTMGHLIAEYSTAASGGSGTSYLTGDHLGTPRVITDASGAVKARHDYLAFGEEIGLKGGRNADPLKYVTDTVRQKFTSKERDTETGLDYFMARYYSSPQGRFTSPDPFSIIQMRQSARDDEQTNSAFNQFVGDPRRWHRFAYAINSPLVFTDKTGLDIMIIENGPTSGNPIGHTAIAITGRGVYSMGNGQTERQQDGNNNIVGGGVRAYLEREIPRRDTTVIIIKTTPAQDAAAEAALINMAKTRPMLQSDATLSTDNCSTRVNEALDAAGIPKSGNPAVPGSAGDRAKNDGAQNETLVTVFVVPQNQEHFLMIETQQIQQFEPRPRPSTPIPAPGTPGGTPVVTMPTITRRPDQPQP